jgi:hypothetical protein
LDGGAGDAGITDKQQSRRRIGMDRGLPSWPVGDYSILGVGWRYG